MNPPANKANNNFPRLKNNGVRQYRLNEIMKLSCNYLYMTVKSD